MRRILTSPPAPRRWRRRRAARIAVAAALVIAAPVVARQSPAEVPAPPTTDARHHADNRDVRVVPIPLADPTVADLLSAGDLVDLIGTVDPDSPGGPLVIARAARVADTPAGRGGSRSILVEVPESDAARVASHAAGTPLAILVHG
ncbi:MULTISPECIES: hypothetical protein [unclassified Dietzia]|uniref:hypothetical protein n=1 Tax=unclassified Dietzia TaxID=2617939 RepID=UPI000D20C964|nr:MULTISPECIES: hypothetical protein [unclassified Dietzia]AVZ39953.1 hypothetical protein CT688_11295 [Dietzia sp. JS16-p6b]